MKLFFIIFIILTLNTSAYSQDKKEQFDCLLFETFLKDLIILDGYRLGWTGFCYDGKKRVIDGLTVIFTEKSNSLSLCQINSVNSYARCNDKDTCSRYKEIEISFIYKQQEADTMNQGREFIELPKTRRPFPLVITAAYEKDDMFIISSRQQASAKTTTLSYKKQGSNFILQNYHTGQY